MKIIQDIICQVYAGNKSKMTIEKVLKEFIPGYEKLNPDYACKIEDDRLIMSLTIDGDQETGLKYFDRLKEILKSNLGVISYINPAEYDNGHDFIAKYGQNSSI